jgi:hypothetical protein
MREGEKRREWGEGEDPDPNQIKGPYKTPK